MILCRFRMKAHLKVLNILVIIVAITKVSAAREEWVDPYDLNIKNPAQVHKIKSSEDVDSCNCNFNVYKDRSSPHLREIINSIIDMTHYDRRSEVYKGVIDIHLNTDDYNFLRKYTADKLNDEHILRQLSEVLKRSLVKSFYSTYFFTIGEYAYLLICNESTLLSFGLLVALFILWKLQPHNYKMVTLFKLFFPLVYISDFYLRYQAKLEAAEIDKYLQYEGYKECDPNNLDWLPWIYDKFTGYCRNNKREFLLSQRASIHIVTPLKVLSEQFDIFVTILKYLGAGFGSFMWALIEDVPWYVKPLLGIFSSMLVLILLLMLGSYVFGIYPKFNLFHLFHFEISQERSSVKENRNKTSSDCLSGDNLKNLLESRNQNPVLMLAGANTQRKNSQPAYKTKPKLPLPVRKKSQKTGNKRDLDLIQVNSDEL